MQFINIKELVFKDNGFEPTKIDHMNYSNIISKDEFNKVVDRLVKDLSGDDLVKNTVMKTPMSESKTILICYNDKGILTKILIVYITDTQDKLPTKTEEEVKPSHECTCKNKSKKSDIDRILDILESDEWKNVFNNETKALLLASILSTKIDEARLKSWLDLSKEL